MNPAWLAGLSEERELPADLHSFTRPRTVRGRRALARRSPDGALVLTAANGSAAWYPNGAWPSETGSGDAWRLGA